MKTAGGMNKGKIARYCKWLEVSTEAFYKFINRKEKVDKYKEIKDKILQILNESEYNDRYGKNRMLKALEMTFPEYKFPSKSVIYRIMKEMKIQNKPKKGPTGCTIADKKATKSDDLLQRDFYADKPYTKLITDITEVKIQNVKLYVAVIFDCYSLKALGIAIGKTMDVSLVIKAIESAYMKYPQIREAILHSDRGSQYTSEEYREKLKKFGIIQSMNSEAGRCHDNARCESMWARFKEEFLYGRYEKCKMSYDRLMQKIWRYFMGYWNNIRICSAIGGITPTLKEQKYFMTAKNDNSIIKN